MYPEKIEDSFPNINTSAGKARDIMTGKEQEIYRNICISIFWLNLDRFVSNIDVQTKSDYSIYVMQ